MINTAVSPDHHDRDADTGWTSAVDDKREERRYYCQNWRADVSAILTDAGSMVEWVKYSSYGVPFALPAGDTDSDGDWDATDSGNITGTYDVRKDANLDGTISAADVTHANSITGGYQTLGRGILSSSGVANRKGYAGYEYDPTLEGAGRHLYHVRHRVYDADTGRWTRRDPLGYVDGMSLYEYVSGRVAVGIDPTGLRSLAGQGITTLLVQGSPVGPQPASCLGGPVYCSSAGPDGLIADFRTASVRAVHSALVGIPDFLWHGNHCGPGYGDNLPTCGDDGRVTIGHQQCGPKDGNRLPDGTCPITSESDACCKEHDRCYYKTCISYTPWGKTECQKLCDSNICSCLKNARKKDFCEKWDAFWMEVAFCNFNKGLDPWVTDESCDNGRPDRIIDTPDGPRQIIDLPPAPPFKPIIILPDPRQVCTPTEYPPPGAFRP